MSPTENYERFKSVGIDDKAVPVSVDATKGLPFANRYFDLLFTVDAYHYFGDTEEMLPSLIPFIKKGGYIAVAIPRPISGNTENRFMSDTNVNKYDGPSNFELILLFWWYYKLDVFGTIKARHRYMNFSGCNKNLE